MRRIIPVALLLLILGACEGKPPRDASGSGAERANIERVLGRSVTDAEATRALNGIFAAGDPGGSAYCCGPARCECTDLGDCINLWFAAVCADIPGPDIVGGECVNNGSCTNEDCSCPD